MIVRWPETAIKTNDWSILPLKPPANGTLDSPSIVFSMLNAICISLCEVTRYDTRQHTCVCREFLDVGGSVTRLALQRLLLDWSDQQYSTKCSAGIMLLSMTTSLRSLSLNQWRWQKNHWWEVNLVQENCGLLLKLLAAQSVLHL